MVALMVLVTFVVSISIFGWVNFARKRRAIRQSMDVALQVADGDLLRHFGHTWAVPLGVGRVRIGLDSFARHLIGKADEIRLPAVGSEVKKGEGLFQVRQGKRTLSTLTPFAGKVLRVNETPDLSPGLADPDAWVCEMEASGSAVNNAEMLRGEAAKSWMEREFQRVIEVLTGGYNYRERLGTALPDGGTIVDGLLAEVDDETWERITREIFHSPAGKPAE